MKNIKGAIFDADGTLFDSMWMWDLLESEYLAMVNRFSKTGAEISGWVDTKMKDFYSNKVLLKPGVSSVLEAFSSRGIKMCVATATGKHLITLALQKTKISGYFGKVFTCGDEKTNKNHPDIYIRAAEFLGTDIKETLVIEDALYAIETAISAGFPVAGVYDLSADMHQGEIKKLCDYYLVSIDEILEF